MPSIVSSFVPFCALQCAIGYEGVDCTIPIITSAQEEEPPDPFWLIVLYFASVTVAAPFCCASLITIWRKCSHPLNRVAPDEQKKDRSLFMPREARVASAQGVDVLNMVDLQPIAPTGMQQGLCLLSVPDVDS